MLARRQAAQVCGSRATVIEGEELMASSITVP
jgi:hypothetical protein